MRKPIVLTLILTFVCPLILPLKPLVAFDIDNQNATLMAERHQGGGNRSGGNRSSSGNRTANRSSSGINRSQVGASGSGRIDRKPSPSRTVNRPEGGIDRSRVGASGSGRINKDQAQNRTNNINRDQAQNRTNNIDRNQVNNRVNNIDRDNTRNRVSNTRDIDLNADRNYSNRVNRNLINTGNRNVIVNPRGATWGGTAWGWNRGVAWAPNYGYWGGGFWGGVALGAVATGVTSAIVNSANNQPTYVVIERGSPGYTLFDSYGLQQVQCVESESMVFIYGPQDSLICALPNSVVSAGFYDVDPETLVLVAR